MSKQLAISSAFAIFAMAAMTLTLTSERSALGSGDAFAPVQAEMPGLEWPKAPFSTNS